MLQESRREMEKLQVSTMRSATVTELENPANQCCSNKVKHRGIVLHFTSSASEQFLEHTIHILTIQTPAQLPLLPGKCHLNKVDIQLFIHSIQTQKHNRLFWKKAWRTNDSSRTYLSTLTSIQEPPKSMIYSYPQWSLCSWFILIFGFQWIY